MTFFFVRHKREAVAEFSFCNGPFLFCKVLLQQHAGKALGG